MRDLMNPINTPDELFHGGNPANGDACTVVTDEWLNDVQASVRSNQSELLSILSDVGLIADIDKEDQVLEAIKQLIEARFAAVRTYRPGQFVASFGTTPLEGTLACRGGVISRTTYADLFAVIGTQYGVGDGSTTFNLPNISDSFALMAANGNAVGSGTVGSVISHAHTAWTDTQGAHSHYYVAPSERYVASGSNLRTDANAAGAHTDVQGAHGHNVGIGATGGSYNYAAGFRLLFCIAF